MKEVLKNRARKDFEMRQYKDFTNIANKTPFVSEGKAMFYSGKNNWNRAQGFAKDNKMVPIEKSFGGGILDKAMTKDRFGTKMTEKLWHVASRRYAAQVKGNVKTFVSGSQAHSVFRKTELPTILNNKKVKEINGTDRTKIDQLRRSRFNTLRQQGIKPRVALTKANETAYRKVAVSEIRQDLNRAKTAHNDALAKDARIRLQTLREQNKLEVLKAKVLKEKSTAQNLQQTAKTLDNSVKQSDSLSYSKVKDINNLQEKAVTQSVHIDTLKQEFKNTIFKGKDTHIENFSKGSELNKGH